MARTKTAKTNLPATKTELIDYILKNYTFGKEIDAKLELLNKGNPLENPPEFLTDLEMPLKVNKYDPSMGIETLYLGKVYDESSRDTFDVSLRIVKGNTSFKIGCSRENSKVSALGHWKDGRSTISGERRPYMAELIEWIDSVCKYHGWKW